MSAYFGSFARLSFRVSISFSLLTLGRMFSYEEIRLRDERMFFAFSIPFTIVSYCIRIAPESAFGFPSRPVCFASHA